MSSAPTPRRPVVFIHGLWIHSAAWRPWQDLFAAAGYEPHAPGWTGDGATVDQTREHPEALAGLGIEAVTAGYRDLIAELPVAPIVVGHSFGGLVAQKLLTTGHAAAAVVLSPAPIKGVTKLPFAQIRSALPVLRRPGNRTRAVSLTERQFRYAFGNALTAEESRTLHRSYAIPGPGRPVFELTAAKKDPASATAVDVAENARGPLLVLAADKDHTVPEIVSRQAYDLYAGSTAVTDYHVFDDRGHAFPFDGRWQDVADHTVRWLTQQEESGSFTTGSTIRAAR